METIKRVIALTNIENNITKDKVYEVNYIHYGQTVYYDLIDDNGLDCRYRADDFIDTKQVVVRGYDSYYNIITPYWIVEYYKRKDITLFIYEWRVNENGNVYYKLMNPSQCNDFGEDDIYYYSLSYHGEETFSENMIMDNMRSGNDLLKDIAREDLILVEIAREINDTNVIKVIDVPIGVDYTIEELKHSNGEYIEETHREWY